MSVCFHLSYSVVVFFFSMSDEMHKNDLVKLKQKSFENNFWVFECLLLFIAGPPTDCLRQVAIQNVQRYN